MLLHEGDILDHIQIIVETIDALEEDAKMLSDLVFNSITHSTNKTMKWLALLSMIFLPITFLAGVYGYALVQSYYFRMNFIEFPELHLGIMHFWVLASIIVSVTLIVTYKLGMYCMFDYNIKVGCHVMNKLDLLAHF